MLKTIGAAFAVAGLLLIAGPAHAHHTDGGHGVLSGNQVIAPLEIPINVCGNAVPVLGIGIAGCAGGATTR
ncbi:chaplin [Rhizohabitans arisaemae]|uniref:chaplin n=1 Tax=Rhizohabitans arisaemae TaxID=2720610 RepID=UPI0024B1D1E2|nr:chaplin [Rhizohabitans arisaemae]